MSAKTVVLLIQNVLTKKFIHFNPSSEKVELQTYKFSKGMCLSLPFASSLSEAYIYILLY